MRKSNFSAGDAPKHVLWIAGRMYARDNDEEFDFHAVEDLERESSHQTAAGTTVEHLARFRKVEQRGQYGIDSADEFAAETYLLGFVPFERGGDIVFRRIEEPDRASRLSRQGVT